MSKFLLKPKRFRIQALTHAWLATRVCKSRESTVIERRVCCQAATAMPQRTSQWPSIKLYALCVADNCSR
jgi:hypothetical protein